MKCVNLDVVPIQTEDRDSNWLFGMKGDREKRCKDAETGLIKKMYVSSKVKRVKAKGWLSS